MDRDQKTRRHIRTGPNPAHRAEEHTKTDPGPAAHPPQQPDPAEPTVDEVDEALKGTFPASDPPAYGTGHA